MADFAGGAPSGLFPVSGDGPVELPDSPIPEKTDSGDMIVIRRYYCHRTDLKDWLDSLNIGDPDAEWTNAKLNGATTGKASPAVFTVDLRYAEANASLQVWPPVGDVTRRGSASPEEVPLPEAPASPGAADQEIARRKGVEAVLVPMPEYSRTEIQGSFTWSEANIIGNTAKIDTTPEGMSSPTPNAWLQMERNIEENGSKTRVTDSWRNNPTGWDTTLYNVVP